MNKYTQIIVNTIPANLSKKFFINPDVFWVKK